MAGVVGRGPGRVTFTRVHAVAHSWHMQDPATWAQLKRMGLQLGLLCVEHVM